MTLCWLDSSSPNNAMYIAPGFWVHQQDSKWMVYDLGKDELAGPFETVDEAKGEADRRATVRGYGV